MYNSTIISKKKNLACGHFDFNFSKGRCRQCATVENTLKRMNEQDEKEEGLSELIAECDNLFSKYIRLKYSGKEGIVKCYTCDKPFKIGQIQNGHYISRYSMLLRFDERNCRPQCEDCNKHKRGNLAEYGKRLEAENNGITEILYHESQLRYKYSRDELKQLALDLQNKIAAFKSNI